MSETPKKILDIKNLDISFKTNAGIVHAIRGVSLDLCKGETVAVVGESGSGKSVTMKAAMGLLDSNAIINSGEILYTYTDKDGNEVTTDLLKLSRKELRRDFNGQRIAMVFQDPMTSLDPTMTIGKQIMEGMFLHKHMEKEAARQRAIELLDLVGIPDAEKRFKNYPHQLSGGMRQRVVIAIALSADPDILICDEPTTALDVTIQARILELIMDIQKKMKLSVIYITHDLGVVAKVADYVNVMYAGKIVEVLQLHTIVLVEVKEVVTLQKLVGELSEGKTIASSTVQTLLDTFLGHHIVDSDVLTHLTGKVKEGKVLHPVVVVHHQGSILVLRLKIEELGYLSLDALLVMTQRFVVQQVTLLAFS